MLLLVLLRLLLLVMDAGRAKERAAASGPGRSSLDARLVCLEGAPLSIAGLLAGPIRHATDWPCVCGAAMG